MTVDQLIGSGLLGFVCGFVLADLTRRDVRVHGLSFPLASSALFSNGLRVAASTLRLSPPDPPRATPSAGAGRFPVSKLMPCAICRHPVDTTRGIYLEDANEWICAGGDWEACSARSLERRA